MEVMHLNSPYFSNYVRSFAALTEHTVVHGINQTTEWVRSGSEVRSQASARAWPSTIRAV